jgi:hypothetical protein
MYKAFIENRGDAKYYATTRHSTFVLDTEAPYPLCFAVRL